MKVFTTIFFLSAFVAFTAGMPKVSREIISIDTPRGPHEVYSDCRSCRVASCAGHFLLDSFDCQHSICWEGYFCASGYIRESPNGLCILPSECPTSSTTTSPTPSTTPSPTPTSNQ